MPEEIETTEEGLSKALADLQKAVDADGVLSKADQNNVESSGTVGSDGPQGGGRGSYPGDAEVDTLMIGKLGEIGFSASQISAMTGALKKDAEEEEEEEGEGEVEIEVGKMRAYAAKNNGSIKGYPPFGKSASATYGGEPLTKAMESYREDPNIDLDAMPFLESFVARTAGHLDDINLSLQKGQRSQANVNKALATSLQHTCALVKSQAHTIQVLGERLGIVERQPMPQRGVTTAAALQKSMPGEAGDNTQLQKSEIVSTLSYMNLEKGMKDIDGTSTFHAIGLLESGGQVAPNVWRAVQQFHRQNPQESTVARNYR